MTPEKFPLFLIITSVTGVCPWPPSDVLVRSGELVALRCPVAKGNAWPTWTRHGAREVDVSGSSAAELRRMEVLLHPGSLVILRASKEHQGNYSCTLGNVSSWFSLLVYDAASSEPETWPRYPLECRTGTSCTLRCPKVNVPAVDATDITDNGVTWYKDGESRLESVGYFSHVEESNRGVYTCVRSYLSSKRLYNMSFTMELNVKPGKDTDRFGLIIRPRENEVFYIDLGSSLAVDCEAMLFSDMDDVSWLCGDSAVTMNDSSRVFLNVTSENGPDMIKTTVWLIFRRVLEEDLSKNYTCKLESDHQLSSYVTITLALKARPSYVSLALSVLILTLAMAVTVFVYVRFKIDIVLLLRDSLGCRRRAGDGKSYDAFLMCYESDTDAGLNPQEREWLVNLLEERFGYSLCLYDRDVTLGKAVAEAVQDCVDQSRAVVLVPAALDPGLGSGLLSAVHAALVERQASLIFVESRAAGSGTGSASGSRSGSLQEALQLLGKGGRRVTWEGASSMSASSAFCKRLRYHLPAVPGADSTTTAESARLSNGNLTSRRHSNDSARRLDWNGTV